MANDTVCIGYCHPGTVTGGFATSLANTCLKLAGTVRSTIAVESGPLVDRSRNAIIRDFLDATDDTWLLMVDTDIIWKPQQIPSLIAAATERGAGIMAGLYFSGGATGITYPLIYRTDIDDDGTPVPRRVAQWPRGAVIRCDGTGFGFMLIARAALQVMRDRYADRFPGAEWCAFGSHRGVDFGEDITFCVRARQAGIATFIHTGVVVGHIKTRVFDEHVYDEYVASTRTDDDLLAESADRYGMPVSAVV